MVDIALAIRPDARESVADYIQWLDLQRSVGHRCDRWLVSVEGRVVGSASLGQSSVYTLPPEIIAVYVAVHPDHQGQGYGRALLERAEGTAAEQKGTNAYRWSDETQPRAMHFLERAGYREVDRGWQSTLDLTQCEPTGLRDAVDRVASSGIRLEPVATFASERDDWKQGLHRLYAELETDVPAPFPIQKVPFEEFDAQNLGRRLISDGFLVALDGDRLVGLTEPRLVDDAPLEISQNLTGVDADYRGSGIAMALKSQAVIRAVEAGCTSIRTHNAQSNASMLAINDRLGFQRDHATVVYLKDL